MRKFTKLMAALALLLFMTPTMVGWGQTRTVTYEAATSIAVDDVVLLVAESSAYKKELSGFSTTSTIYGMVTDFTTAPAGVYPLTVVAGASEGSFAFKNSDNKYLSWSSGNSLGLSETLNNNSSWTYNYAYTVTTISNVATTNRQIKYNSSSPRFACYTSGQQSVKLYKQVNSSLEDSDLAITGSPVALSFDLYNNSTAQVINYTTSSTGEVTVSDSDYITAMVDQTNKTITVTPIAVTNGAKVITVNQAADDNYAAGSKTFTINITDSTPYVQPTTIEANLNNALFGTNYSGSASGITDENPVVGTLNGVTITYAGSGNHYINDSQIRFYPNNKLTFDAPSGYEITQIVFTSAGTWAATISADNGTYNTSTKTWTGSETSVLFTGSGSSRCDMSKATITLAEISSAVATTTTINVPQNFNTDIYQGTNAGTLTATVTAGETTLNNPAITWESSNTSVATIDNGVVTLIAVGTTTITASYDGVEGEYRPSYATYELTVTSSEPIPGTETDPYTVAEAITFIDGLDGATSDEVYVTGIISQIESYSSQYHSITYWISDDGTTTNQLQVYSGKGLNGANFNSINDLIVGSTVTVKGNLKKYGDVYEFNYNSEIVSLTLPPQYTLTAAMTNVAEYFVFVGEDEIVFDNNNQAQVTAGATIYVSLTMEDCYALNSLTVNGSTTGVTEVEPGVYYSFVMPAGDATIGVSSTQATEYTLTVVGGEGVSFDLLAGSESTPVSLTNGTATLCEQSHVTIANLTANTGLLVQSVTLTAGGSTTTLTPESGVYQFNMPSSNATLTITTATTPTYTLANNIVSGKTYIIVGFDDDDNAYAMGEQKTNNRAGVGITVDGNTATGNANVHEVVITVLEGDDAGKYTIYEGGYLYAANSNANQLKTESTLDDNGKWTIVIANGEATITAQGNNSRNLMRFNPNNGSPLFACYANSSTTGSLPKLYVKDETPVTEPFTLTINGFGANTNPGGYNLIASPLATAVIPTAVTNMVSNTYDLYRFDQNEESEWQNYKGHQDGFTLEPGKGYLYANSNTVDLIFTGTAYNGDEFTVPLVYTPGAEFAGWNLVGSPFADQIAHVDNAHSSFYTMNDEGTAFVGVTENTVQPKQGIFVLAHGENETVTFTRGTAKKSPTLALNLRQGHDILDRITVRFDEGNQLPKFQLFKNSTKLYIPVDGQDYAVVCSEEMGAMPVNFKAENNGTYTLSLSSENVEFAYLHLIDNMTGADIDLLQTPSYSFEAKTTDYANRFKLVFAAGDNSNVDNFAFFSNGSFVINNEGNATLQVIDVNGRIIKSESINGCANVNVNAANGIYMLRLVNGDNVKVQKVVVK